MQCHHCPRRFFDRGEFGMHSQSHSDRQQEIQSHDTEIGAFLRACALDGPRKVVLQATTLLSKWNYNAPDGLVKPVPDIQSFQDALRKFPPRPGRDGSSTQQRDISCNDCAAVFSSKEELRRHRLTRFCPGSAIVVYVMMRDPLIYKGYRIEKRLVPLDGQPLRVPCGKCPEIFSDDDAKEAHENLHQTHDLICLQCDLKCDTPYELKIHYDLHDDMEFRQSRAEPMSKHSRTASHPQMKFYVPPSSLPSSPTENGVRRLAKRKSQRLLDAWPLKKGGQDDGELIAIGFVVPEDLERVHAAEGTIQEVDPDAIVDFPMAQFTTWLDTQDTDARGTPDMRGIDFHNASTDGKFALASVDEDKKNLAMSGAGSSLNDHKTERKDIPPRRMSLLKSVLGLRLRRRLSRSDIASIQPRKLLKKESSVRFSIMSNQIKSEDPPSRSQSRTSWRTSEQRDRKMSGGLGAPPDGQSQSSSERNSFIHMRITSDGAVVEDATGRRRILQLEQIGHIYSIVSAQFSLSGVSSRIGALKSRAEMNFHGRPKTALSAYHDVLDILHQYPPMDVDLRTRAEILHRMGEGYSMLSLAGEAESCFLETLTIYKRIFGRDYAPTFAVLKDIAKLCERDGYATEAAELYERVVAGRLRVLGPFAPETLSTMEDLARIKMSLGDLDSAVQLFEEVIPAFETVRGLQNESTLNAMNHISTLYQKLGLSEKSLAISRKMMPHCRTALGLDSALTRDAVAMFLEHSGSFDFPLDVKVMLDYYRRSRSADNLRVLQGLGRAYMNVGLNRDACELFEHLVIELSTLKGADSLEAFDALSGVCVSLEHLGSLDKAIQTYGHLLQLGSKLAPDHPCRIRMEYARQRVTDLIHRRGVLNAERRAWDLFEDGPCVSCQSNTSCLCSTCHMVRFCSVACHDRDLPKHQPSCIPSVTLRESKSVAITPRCPSPVQKDALGMIVPSENGATPQITAAHTVYLDPRNFTTFRMKLSSTVNTMLVFSAEADIRYTIIGNISESGADPVVHPAAPRPSPPPAEGPSPESVSKPGSPKLACEWLTPRSQESVCITPMAQSAPIYLIVAPGDQLMKATVASRVKVRSGGGEKERFEALTVPDGELIEYSQGLVLNEYMGEAFLYIVEWV